jgi:hypothetical protein
MSLRAIVSEEIIAIIFFLALLLNYVIMAKYENPCRLSRIPATPRRNSSSCPLRGFAVYYLRHFMGLTPLYTLFAYGYINMLFMVYYG